MDEPVEPTITEPRASGRKRTRSSQQTSAPSHALLWVLLALVLIAVAGVVAFVALGGLDRFTAATGPAETIEAINQAALAGDGEAYAARFDVAAVAEAAYPLFLDEMKTKPEYAAFIEDVGEEEADRILREEVLPLDGFVADLSARLDIANFVEGAVPFPGYTINQTTINGSLAEIELTTVEDGNQVEWVLGMERDGTDGTAVWRITQIKNIADVFDLAQ